MKKRTKPIHIVGAISIVAILIVAGFSYYLANSSLAEKDDEISSLQELIENKDWQITLLQGDAENHQDFLRMMSNGWMELGTAWLHKGAAQANYDEASYTYSLDFYPLTQKYADSAKDSYDFAAQSYGNAKAFFQLAKNYASTDTLYQLAAIYGELVDSGAKLMYDLYEANEYFAAAANEFERGDYVSGNAYIELMNQSISEHDNEAPIYNDYLSQIYALLETL